MDSIEVCHLNSKPHWSFPIFLSLIFPCSISKKEPRRVVIMDSCSIDRMMMLRFVLQFDHLVPVYLNILNKFLKANVCIERRKVMIRVIIMVRGRGGSRISCRRGYQPSRRGRQHTNFQIFPKNLKENFGP